MSFGTAVRNARFPPGNPRPMEELDEVHSCVHMNISRRKMQSGFCGEDCGLSQAYRADARNVSSEPGCPRDQEQPSPEDDGSDGSCEALTGGCETFDGNGGRHDSHRAQIHDPKDEED